MINKMTRPFAEAHEALTSNGYSPIPIVPETKRPALKKWSAACYEPLDRIVRERFARQPSAFGLGIALGLNEFVAIDPDVEEPAIVAALKGALPSTPVKKKGRKGATGFFRLRGAASRRFRDRSGRTLIELLGPGCQTIVPPTVHPVTQIPYEWIGRATLFDVRADELPELPSEIILRIEEALRPWLPTSSLPVVPKAPIRTHDRYIAAIIQRRIAELAQTAEGGRNTELNAAAFRLARVGLGQDDVFDILAPVAAQIGLAASEIERTIHSAWVAGSEGRSRT